MVNMTLLHMRAVYGEHAGRAHIAIGSGPHITAAGRYEYRDWRQHDFAWPAEAELIAREVQRAAHDADVYFCPNLMHANKRTPGAAVVRQTVHADVDNGGLDLDDVRALGGFAVASGSPDNGHVYLTLTEPVPGHWHKALEGALVAHLGADPSKINTNDLLRPVGTLNHKAAARHGANPTPVEFLIEPAEATPVDPRELAAMLGVTLPDTVQLTPPQSLADERHVAEPVPESPELAALTAEIQRDDAKKRKANGDVDRSEDLCRVVNLCARQGLSVPQTRGLIRSLRADLAAKLDRMGRDEVAHLHASYTRFTDGKRAEWEVDRRGEAEFFAASTGRPRQVGELTDKGNADLLRDKQIGGTRWCPDLGAWLHYTGRRWEKQPDAGIVREAAAGLELDRGDSSKAADEFEKAVARHYKYSRSDRGISAMVALLRDQAAMRVSAADLDGYAYELNTQDGIVQLRTGALGPSMPEHFHTKLTAVGYDPSMPTPMWNAFLHTTFGGDADLIDFMRRLCGLASIGEVLEHVLPFLFGQGSNGKSVFAEVLLGVLGNEYAITAPANFLIAGRDKHETEIARLDGARLVVSSEVNKDAQFDEQKTKILTGGDRLSGRGMRENFRDFVPSHTLFLMGNHKPSMAGGGTSFWRRCKLIPFRHQVAEKDRVEGLAATLIADEGAGILAWIVSGAADYLRAREAGEQDKLRVPALVREASEAYREDTRGSVERFLNECCTVGRDQGPQRASAVYASYRAWAFAMGEQPVTDAQFGLDGSSYGLDKAPRSSSGARYYVTVHTDRLPANESGL